MKKKIKKLISRIVLIKRTVVLLCILCLMLLFCSGCRFSSAQEPLLTESSAVPELPAESTKVPSQEPLPTESSAVPELPAESTEVPSQDIQQDEKMSPEGDVNGDGIQDTVTFKLIQNGFSAIICVNGEDVYQIIPRGEFDFSFAQIATEDLDSDGRDEVVLYSKIPARYGGFTFQYIEYEDNIWREQYAKWPAIDMSLSNGWQCTLTVNDVQQTTIEIKNTDMRDAYFDENGIPYDTNIYIGFWTDAANHVIEGNSIIFDRYVEVRGKGASDFEPSFDFLFECTVLVEDNRLVIDEADLCQNILLALN